MLRRIEKYFFVFDRKRNGEAQHFVDFAPTYLFVRGDEKNPAKARPLAPGLPPLLALGELDVQPVSLPAEAHTPGLRSFVLDDQLRTAEGQLMAPPAGCPKRITA